MFEEVEGYVESLFVMHEMLGLKKLTYDRKGLTLTRDPKNSNRIWIAQIAFVFVDGSVTPHTTTYGPPREFIVLAIEDDSSCTFTVNTYSFGRLHQSLLTYGDSHEGYKNIQTGGVFKNSFEFNFRELDKLKQFFHDVVWKELKS